MKQLSNAERGTLNKILERDTELFLVFKENLDTEIDMYDENFAKEFDDEYFAEYMQKKLEKTLSFNKEAILKRLDQGRMTEEQMLEVFEESGSMGLTMLIEEFLNAMDKDKDVNRAKLDILVTLIHTRNKLQIYEIEYLQEEYKEFLKNKLATYQNNNV